MPLLGWKCDELESDFYVERNIQHISMNSNRTEFIDTAAQGDALARAILNATTRPIRKKPIWPAVIVDCEKTNRCKSYRTISINGMLLAICRASIAIANATAGSSEQTAADGITFVFLTIPPCFVCVRDPVRTAAEQPVPRQFLIG